MSTRKPVAQLRDRPGTQTAPVRPLVGAVEVPIKQVVPDDRQPRRDWDHGEGRRRLEELAASIREFGVLQPLLVRQDGTFPDGGARYRIIAGGRRRTAAEMVDLATLPVVVRGEEAQQVRVLQLIENLQRQDLSPLDEARAYQELIDADGLSPQALAERLHISGQHVRERLRLLADQVFADAVERRQISATAARDIMRLPDEEIARFRQRVLAGETLQSNDVARARAHLTAAGVANPRFKGGGRPARSGSSSVSSAVERTIILGPAGDQTVDVGAPTPASVTAPVPDQATLDHPAAAATEQSAAHTDVPPAPAPRQEVALIADERGKMADTIAGMIVVHVRDEARTDIVAVLAQVGDDASLALAVIGALRRQLDGAR